MSDNNIFTEKLIHVNAILYVHVKFNFLNFLGFAGKFRGVRKMSKLNSGENFMIHMYGNFGPKTDANFRETTAYHNSDTVFHIQIV